jgi:leader peptidase (prepilin peptidase)/N-methyltransferase
MIISIIILGLVFGSFINACVWRVHKQSNKRVNYQVKAKYSLLTGRSMCPDCEHVLSARDLLPIVSWLLLRGKCRYCKSKISAQYPIVESTTVLLFITSYFYWPYTFSGFGLISFIFWLAILVNLIALTIYDIKWMILPNKMIYPVFILALSLIAIKYIFFSTDSGYFLGCIYGFLIGGGIFYVLFQVSSGQWIGGGDVKLGAALGLILGSGLYAGLMIFLSSLLGTLIAIPLMATGRLNKKALIPYGPLLIAAAIIIELFGGSLVGWLKTKGVYI